VDLFPQDRSDWCLQSANPADWPVAAGWHKTVDAFFDAPSGRALRGFLAERLAQEAVIYPPQPLRALALTPPEQVHTVILGQDPYHGRGQAEGLAFSVAPGQPVPPSLRNIFKERQRDLGEAWPAMPVPGGSLVAWAQQGVLLLNTCLTVEDGQPASHQGKGWEALTDALIAQVSGGTRRVVFMLWGAPAQKKDRSLTKAGTWFFAPTILRPCLLCGGLHPLSAAVISRAHKNGAWPLHPARTASIMVPRRARTSNS